MFDDWLKDIHTIIAQRHYQFLSKLQDSHFISRLLVLFYDVLTYLVLFCTHLQFICLLSFFTVSVFCLASAAASGGNSLLFY